MADTTDTTEKILETMAGPKKIEIDGQKIENYSVDELVKAANYVAMIRARQNRKNGLSFTKLKNGGAV